MADEFLRQYAADYRQKTWDMPLPERRPWSHGRIAAILGLLSTLLLTFSAPHLGLTWDEPAYFAASESYVAWLGRLFTQPAQALGPAEIEHYWSPNHEHPPLDKIWSGLVWSVARYGMDDLLAHRLGNILLSGGLIAMLYLLVAPEWGRLAGLATIASLLTMPRFFFHAQLGALDVPAAIIMVAVVLLVWRTRHRRGIGLSLLLGLVWGLALATKINAIFIMPALGLWAIAIERRLRLVGRLVLMGLIGVPFSLLLWPWLYHDSWDRLVEYVAFITVKHWQIGQWYFGRFYLPPPWHFPLVMIVAVVPLAVTILWLVGAVRSVWGGRSESLGWLCLFCALVSILALSTGKSVVYDNERLAMPAFPFLAVLAGRGFVALVQGIPALARRIKRDLTREATIAALALVCFVPQTIMAGLRYPYLLSYYSASIGGLPGASRLGMEHSYWCETYVAALPYLNERAPRGATIWIETWSHDVMLYYQKIGRLRPDLRITSGDGAQSVFGSAVPAPVNEPIGLADIAVVEYRQGSFGDTTPRYMQDRTPVYRLVRSGVTLMEIYRQ